MWRKVARPTKPISALKRHISEEERARRESAEARFDTGTLPRCPIWLDASARRVWRRLVGELKNTGLLTGLDTNSLAVLCDAAARHAEAAALVVRDGPVLQGARGPMQNPAVAVAARYAGIVDRLGSRFGLSPESRAKLAATIPAEPEPDPESNAAKAQRMFPEVFGRQKKE